MSNWDGQHGALGGLKIFQISEICITIKREEEEEADGPNHVLVTVERGGGGSSHVVSDYKTKKGRNYLTTA